MKAYEVATVFATLIVVGTSSVAWALVARDRLLAPVSDPRKELRDSIARAYYEVRDLGRRPFRRLALPCSVTLLGLLLGVLGLYLWPRGPAALLLLASLVCDGLDGWLARTYNAETRLGSELDLAVDQALALGILFRLSPPLSVYLLPLFAIAWALGRSDGARLSLRVPVTAVALGCFVAGVA